MSKVIICDWNRTLFNPITQKIYSDTLLFLRGLSREKLFLVSVNELGNNNNIKIVGNFFVKIIVGEKTENIFRSFCNEVPVDNVWVVGDKIDSEICLGNKCDFQTIRVRRGKFRNQISKSEQEKPKYTANDLQSALKIILSK